MFLTLAEIQAFLNFVNGNLGKKVFTDALPSATVAGKKLVTTGIGLGVELVDDISTQLGIAGTWDMSTSLPPTGVKIGERYFVGVDGTFNGIPAKAGDVVEFTTLTSIFVYPLASTLVRLSTLSDYATKTYAEGLVVGLLDDRGGYDPTITSGYPTNVNSGSGVNGDVMKGDLWFFVSDGICGANTVLTGYSVRALVDNPGQTDSNWNVLNVGLGYVPENVANKKTSLNGALSSPNDTDYPTTKVVDDALDLKADILDQTHTGAMRLPSSLKIYDTVAPTKEVAVDVSGLTAGSPRTVTFPDRDITLGSLPPFTATTHYGQRATIQEAGLMYSAKVDFTSGAAFDLADWDAVGSLGLKLKLLGYGTSPETLEVGYEYINTNQTNISSVVYEMPDPEFVPDGSRIVIHNLKFDGSTSLGTSNWTQGGPSRFIEFPNYSPATTSPIPAYSIGVITTLTSIKAYKLWLKESHRPSKMLPTGDSMRFYREDVISATITNYLGNIPAATNRVITYPDSDVDLGKTEIQPYVNGKTYNPGDVVHDGSQFKNILMCGIAQSSDPFDLMRWFPVGTYRTRITTNTGYAPTRWYSPTSDYGNMYPSYVTLDGTVTTFSVSYGTLANEELTIYNSGSSVIAVTMPAGTFWADTDGAISNPLQLNPQESFVIVRSGNTAGTQTQRVRRSLPYFNSGVSGLRISKQNSETSYAYFDGDALTTGRAITIPDANVDLGIIPNATSSTMASGAFVYATGMGSVVKTITGSGTTFDIDELETNKAHSVTIRSNADTSFPFDTTTTFSFVSTKSFGAGTGFHDESGCTILGTCASGSPFVVTLAPNESWEVRYMGASGFVSYFSVKRNFTPWTAITADTSVSLHSGLSYITTNTSTGKTYTLPAAPTIGNIIKLKCNNFASFVQTLGRNGKTINGGAANLTLNRNGTYTFIYNALSTWETSFEDSVYLDANVISGTRNRVVGGSSNTVSGTDNVAINCYATTLGGSATKVAAINCTSVTVIKELTKALLVGCSDISITSVTPVNDGLVALGVAFKTDVIFEFPQWAGHTLIGAEDGIHSYVTLLGSNSGAGNVNLESSTGVKPLVAISNLPYRKGTQHIIRLVGQDADTNPTKVVTVAYKVVGSVISSGYSLGAVQTIEALFSAVGTPATPTVTISITAIDKLNINVASADAMTWAAHVDSYFA